MDIAPGSKLCRQAARAPCGVKPDGDGRAILTGTLRAQMPIEGAAVAGLGHKFQIWKSSRFRARTPGANAKARAATRRLGFERAAESALGAREW
jgi:DNA-binding transcriptional regulator/RsmH inhibitor MraZ